MILGLAVVAIAGLFAIWRFTSAPQPGARIVTTPSPYPIIVTITPSPIPIEQLVPLPRQTIVIQQPGQRTVVVVVSPQPYPSPYASPSPCSFNPITGKCRPVR